MTVMRAGAIEAATSRPWADWVAYLDGIGARELDHPTIAGRLLDELAGRVENVGWWAQSITVAYEQQIGRRLPGQGPDGTFRLSVTRSTGLGMAELMDEWVGFAAADPDVDHLATTAPRVSGTNRRITWRAKGHHGSTITVTSEPRKDARAALVVEHGGLPTPESSATARETWMRIADRFLAGLRSDRG